MKKISCSLCNRIFTRDWNLKRHIQDVHRLYDSDKKENVNQEIEENYYSPNNNSFYKENDINYYNNHNPYYYNNFPNAFHNPAYYYNYEFYPNSNFNPSSLEKEKRLSVDDKTRIKQVLKVLEKHLEKIFPTSFVVGIRLWLWDSCIQEQSDEPLKKYLKKYNLGSLWPY